MKYPLTVTALCLLGFYVVGTTAYKLALREECAVSVAYEFPGISPMDKGELKKETARFAAKSGYKFMDSRLDGTLTVFAPKDPDRLIVNFNGNAEPLKVSFYDCRKGGNGMATGIAWIGIIGRKYL